MCVALTSLDNLPYVTFEYRELRESVLIGCLVNMPSKLVTEQMLNLIKKAQNYGNN